jgi:hypothetical protein
MEFKMLQSILSSKLHLSQQTPSNIFRPEIIQSFFPTQTDSRRFLVA